MKLSVRNRKREQGGILIVTLFILVAIFIALGSYLMLVRCHYVSIMRSQGWNDAMAMAEAGVEEALAQLNPGATTTNISVNRSANGWGSPANGFYGPVSRTVMSNGNYSVVFNTATFPIIYSTGYVTMPDTSVTLRRVVQVATTNVPLFNIAMAARTNITMHGNGLSANSFDSSNTNLSTNGRFDSSKTSTNGDIAVLYGTLDPGNHSVAGDVYLGPTATFSGGANQVTGKVYNDFTADFPQVAVPNTAGWLTVLPLAGNVSIGGVLTPFDYVFNTSGDYIVPALAGKVYVNANANVRLYIQGGSLGGALVAGSGANAGHLTLYVAAASFSMGGNGSIDGGKAANLSYIGLPSNTSISLSGNAAFTGTIYAPSASLTLNGGGNNDYDFVGSCIAAAVTFNGHFMFHFDEDLLNSGASRGYLAVSWAEL